MSYSYDAMGRRTSKAVQSGTATQYLYDGQNTVQETVGSTINPILIGPGIDERYARNDVTGRTYFIADALNSTIALTDPTGAIKQQYSYDPYGNTTPSDTTTGFTNPYQYTGRDADTAGLYYYRARYYSPMMGGMISEDPARFAGGQLSFYGYAGGDPLDFNDPYGLWAFGDPLPQGVVDAAAGLGDGVSFGITGLIRDAMGTNGVVNRCSKTYGWSHLAGTALPVAGGLGRLAYAGAAAAIPAIADASEGAVAQALEGSAMRNSLKAFFRGDFSGSSTWRMYDPAELLSSKYGGDAAAMLEAAGRTSPYFNALGAVSVFAGAVNEANSECRCH